MKNTSNTLLILLLICTVAFGYKAFFSGDPLYKEKLKELGIKNRKLEEDKKSIDSALVMLQADYQKLVVKDSLLNIRVRDLDKEITRSKAAAAKSYAALAALQRDLQNTRRGIDSLKKNPPNRTGDDLLNSLKIKLTRP